VQGHVWLGLPLMAVGTMLMTPLALWMLVPTAGRLAAGLARIPRALAGRQILRARWRSAAVVTALALCVALVVSAHTQSAGLLAGSKLPTGFPDLMIALPGGIDRQRAQDTFEQLGIEGWTGLNGFDIELVGLEQLERGNIIQALMSWRRGNTWFLSLEPQRMDRVTRLDFVQGTADEAMGQIASGDAIIISKAFSRNRGVNLGDTVSARTSDNQLAALTVVGVVESVAMEAAGVAYDFGDLFLQNAALTVLGSSSTAARLFNQHGYSILLIDVRSPRHGNQVTRQLEELWPDTQTHSLLLSELKQSMERHFRRLTLIFSTIGGLLAAAVASVGVANAMHAGIHSRRRELGILHAIGATRGQLIRLILAEAMILGVVGAVAGVALGIYASRMGLRIHALLIGKLHGLSLPLGTIGVAAALAVTAAVAASVAAAIRAGRANVLDLMTE